MKNTSLVITSIAKDDHPILKQFAVESRIHQVPFILVGDSKSPVEFNLAGCDFYSIKQQQALNFDLAKVLPLKHYARKNLGYLIALSKGAEIIIETDDDNIPLKEFWNERTRQVNAHSLINKDWVNVYQYFTKEHIWPRGFALQHLQDHLPQIKDQITINSPIHQGLADDNPDVDAIYRLILPLPLIFDKADNVALGSNSICPFNSQNTTWFKEAFPLLYLPYYCSFRMTDIWRSFIAQRIAWTCGWSILFHNSTVSQQRNEHDLMIDFKDEIPGYTNNKQICDSLKELNLSEGIKNISFNMITCYQKLIEMGVVGKEEMLLLNAWLKDVKPFIE